LRQPAALKKEAAAIQSQRGPPYFVPEFFKLKCLFGQTAQLPGFSAAWFGFAMHIVAVVEHDLPARL